MSSPIQPGPLKNEQIIHLSSLLGHEPIQMHPDDTALMIRAINLGYVNKMGDQFTNIGKQRLRRAYDLPSSDYHLQLGGDHGTGNRIKTSIFRRETYGNVKDAAESGALYTLRLPISEKTDMRTLKILFDVAKTAALSMENNDKAFDIVVHSHDAVMSTDLTDTLNSIGLENHTVSDMFYRAVEPKMFPHDGFSLCLLRGHDYEPTAVGFSKAKQDGAIYNIPMNTTAFSKGLMTPELWDMIGCIEFSAKIAANCLDGNSDMVLAFAIQDDFSPDVQYVSLNDVKEAYTLLKLTDDPEKTGREPLNLLEACKLAIQSRTKQLSYDLPAKVVEFTDRAINTMIILAQTDESLGNEFVSWGTMLESIEPHVPDCVSSASIDADVFLRNNLSASIYMNMHTYEHNPIMLEHLKEEQKTQLLTAFAVVLDEQRPVLKQAPSEEASALKDVNTMSRPTNVLR